MRIIFKPIGYVRNPHREAPRHWTVSDLEGELDILPEYEAGLADIVVGQRIVVLFHFDRSEPFEAEHLKQKKRNKNEIKGVFSICSPIRPNPIGFSVVTVLAVGSGQGPWFRHVRWHANPRYQTVCGSRSTGSALNREGI